MIRYDLGIMYYLSKILIRILPWDPWLPRCSKNLARSCQDSQDASKRVNPGSYRNEHEQAETSENIFHCFGRSFFGKLESQNEKR